MLGKKITEAQKGFSAMVTEYPPFYSIFVRINTQIENIVELDRELWSIEGSYASCILMFDPTQTNYTENLSIFGDKNKFNCLLVNFENVPKIKTVLTIQKDFYLSFGNHIFKDCNLLQFTDFSSPYTDFMGDPTWTKESRKEIPSRFYQEYLKEYLFNNLKNSAYIIQRLPEIHNYKTIPDKYNILDLNFSTFHRLELKHRAYGWTLLLHIFLVIVCCVLFFVEDDYTTKLNILVSGLILIFFTYVEVERAEELEEYKNNLSLLRYFGWERLFFNFNISLPEETMSGVAWARFIRQKVIDPLIFIGFILKRSFIPIMIVSTLLMLYL